VLFLFVTTLKHICNKTVTNSKPVCAKGFLQFENGRLELLPLGSSVQLCELTVAPKSAHLLGFARPCA